MRQNKRNAKEDDSGRTVSASEKTAAVESAILWICFTEGQSAWEKLNLLDWEFNNFPCRQIYQIMKDLQTENQNPCDFVLIAGKNMAPATNDFFYTKLTSGTGYSKHLSELEFSPQLRDGGAGTVIVYQKELRALNRKYAYPLAIEELGFDTDPDKIEEFMRQRMSPPVENGSLDLKDEFDDYFAELEAQSEGKRVGFYTGYDLLDRTLCGMRPGGLYVLGAAPSIGKSAFYLNVVLNNWDRHVYVCAKEETKAQILGRVVSHKAKVDMGRLNLGNLDSDEWSRVVDVKIDLNESNLKINDDRSLDALGFFEAVTRYNRGQKLDLIVVDHLHEFYGKEQNRHLDISKAAHIFKNLAQKCGCPVLLLSQLRRVANNEKPGIHDLKESGDVEAKADAVILLHRHDRMDPKLNVRVLKNRNGPLGSIDYYFNAPLMKITEEGYES